MKKTILIIDDDVFLAEMLKKMIGLYPVLEFAGHCKSCDEAKLFFQKEVVDIILLDIELSDGRGFDLIPFISGDPAIIIITTNENYAFTAYEVGAIDFLKKPILPARFKRSIDKILQQDLIKNRPVDLMDKNKPFLFVKSGLKIIKIELENLLYVEALRDYIKLVLINKETHLINLSLSELSRRLASHGFIQVHRSYIVSIRHIKQVHDDMIDIQNVSIPVGKTYKSVIADLLQ
jgi:DNA-binding LytR/AlgR family response regulator